MTLIFRRRGPTRSLRLGACGLCRVGLADLVGAWGRGPVTRILFLGDARDQAEDQAEAA